MELIPAEARLIALRRAILRLDREDLIEAADASSIDAYLNALLEVAELEDTFSSKDLEHYLDGLIAGLAIHRAMALELPYQAISKSARDREREFQTGVDPVTGNVNVHQ